MSVRRVRADRRTPAQVGADEALAARLECGKLAVPRLRAASLERARGRGTARRRAREKLRELGMLELPLVTERRGRSFVAYVPGLAGAVRRASSRRAARAELEAAIEELVASDPIQVLETIEARQRVEEWLSFMAG